MFVEFAVNDVKEPREKRERAQGRFNQRKLLKVGIDVVIVLYIRGVIAKIC